MAACSVPGGTPRSWMKRPRPVSRLGSSTRGIDCPTQGFAIPGLPAALTFIPWHSSHNAFCAWLFALEADVVGGKAEPNAGKSQNLPTRLILFLERFFSSRDAKRCGIRAG